MSIEIQPTPHGSGTPIVELVKADLDARAANGRDTLIDAYQEALDLVQYLRQVIEERR